MKVKELVRDTVWIPGSGYDEASKPKVSVLLPTFRRGKSGLFRRCVDSILAQTLTDIEIIIVDDASTDGTAGQIADFMARDGRISCLRHLRNIGLPAISEYEAYLRARADRFAFAFDDTIFNEDALERLLDESLLTPHAAVYGHIEWSNKDPQSGQIVTARLGLERSQGLLRVGNHIPNNAVLLPRKIIEDVGFYDPHVLMARVCDWDLWQRIAERYDLRYVDVAVGVEGGTMTSDSLGKTYELDSWATAEWMHVPRDVQLRPANMGEYEILAHHPNHGSGTQTVTHRAAAQHARARQWPAPPPPVETDTEGYILVVTVQYNASTSLCFDMLPEDVARRVRIIQYNGVFGVEEMARATCVIFVRHIAMFRTWITAAKAIGVPSYFFLDDNLPLLIETGEVTVGEEDYRLVQFREDMKVFDGALLSNRHLVEYFRENLLHDQLYYFPVSFANQDTLTPDYSHAARKGETVIAFAGGSHRAKGLWEVVVPALKKVVSEGAMIHLVTPESHDESHQLALENLPDGLRITTMPYDVGYMFAMRRFARFAPDIVVHAPSDTKNNIYKTLNPLVAATLLDAVLVVPEAPPYDQVAGIGNVVIVKDPGKPLSWYMTLNDLVHGKFDIESIKAKNHAFCIEQFSGVENSRILSEMLARHGGEVIWPEQVKRLNKLAAWQRTTIGVPAATARGENANYSLANEIASYRRALRYSLRLRVMRPNADLWNAVAATFLPLKTASKKMGWRRSGSSLELSDSLHDIPFREYRIMPPNGKLTAVLLAISVDIASTGQIGIEIANPDNDVKDHVVVDLARQNLSAPVQFDLSDIAVRAGEIWSIRVFAHSKTPVYIYEFINRRLFGMLFREPTPFMQFIVE
jgi:hypothetical protein